MTRTAKIIIAIIVFFVVHFLYHFLRYGHSHDWGGICRQHMWIFKDAVKSNVEKAYPFLCTTDYRKQDIQSAFGYDGEQSSYGIIVWEFKDLRDVDLNKISINQNVELDDVKFWSGEILDVKSDHPTTIKDNFDLKHNVNVNLNGFSKIDGFFSGANYKGFYGTVDQMSLSNEKGEHQIVFGGDHFANLYNISHFSKQHNEVIHTPTVLLLYKGHGSFYVIIIGSVKPFKDASIINILNLT